MVKKITNLFKHLVLLSKKHMPKILTFLGITGACSSVALAVKATIPSVRKIDEINELRQARGQDKLTKWEVVKTVWGNYVVVAVTLTGTVASIFMSDKLHTLREITLSSALALTKKKWDEFEQEAKQKFGDKKYNEIKQDISNKRAEEQLSANNIINTGKGNQLFLDSFSGRLFMSDYETIRAAVNDINKDLLDENEKSVNDFYHIIGLPEIGAGEEYGWNMWEERNSMEITVNEGHTSDMRTYWTLEYNCEPNRNFTSRHSR